MAAYQLRSYGSLSTKPIADLLGKLARHQSTRLMCVPVGVGGSGLFVLTRVIVCCMWK